ncbi:hypothetical protein P280DRAFT_464409 [Massarina eburnea CBS 473.64]|uniref:Uncharacterized protein n=1 Tax=Massarina eburnea CBS 473.64 TaxID=1395130 RepID=A0A6A6SIW8_9PLEO|nr:hypothetical protein P280DRAFT_464409 [Massarina eburnea CBS 473.64]
MSQQKHEPLRATIREPPLTISSTQPIKSKPPQNALPRPNTIASTTVTAPRQTLAQIRRLHGEQKKTQPLQMHKA